MLTALVNCDVWGTRGGDAGGVQNTGEGDRVGGEEGTGGARDPEVIKGMLLSLVREGRRAVALNISEENIV